MFALDIVEKTTFLFYYLFKQVFDHFQKNVSRLHYSLSEAFFDFDCLQGLYLTTNTKKVTSHFCGGKKSLGQEKVSQKGDFGFTPKPLPITRLGVHHWKEREKYNQNQENVETFRTFLIYFVSTFSQIFITFFSNFLGFE